MHRFAFVLHRPLQLVPVLIGISIVTFVLVHAIPGDPVRLLLGARGTLETAAAIRAQYGLDQPVVVQYGYFIANLLQGELGRSIIYKAPVLAIVVGRILPTLFLLAYAVILSVLLAVALGSLAAARRGRLPDQAVRLFSTIGLGLPNFWLGIIFIMVLSLGLGWFPTSGYGDGLGQHLHHLFLPALTVAASMAPVLTRNLRASLIAESTADYVSAAKAKGLPRHVIFFHHIFRNSLIPTVNLLGVNVGWLIGGTVVVENVFSIPGLGSLLVSSIFARDYLVVQSVTLILAVGVVLTNFIVDIATVALDPRIEP
jgi:peptide/nickel transport system permease protein